MKNKFGLGPIEVGICIFVFLVFGIIAICDFAFGEGNLGILILLYFVTEISGLLIVTIGFILIVTLVIIGINKLI